MPYALSAEVAQRWAHDRAIAIWALFAGDLPQECVERLVVGAAAIRADGGCIVLVVPPAKFATPEEGALADIVVEGAPAPQPFGLFCALAAGGIADVRRLGVLGASREVLEAGHRAGSGAIVGIAGRDPVARRPLLDAEPDAIIAPDEFTDLDRDRYASGRAHRQRVLLNPGPAVVSDRVHRSVAGPDLCHREAEYSAILDRVRDRLFRVAQVDAGWAAVMLAGSGTAAMEAMTGASVRTGRKLLVCKNGVYGERIETIARRLGIEVVLVESSPLAPIDPAAVGAALAADATIDAVAVIHHETTTGLLNPVDEIARIAKERGVLTIVDAISSFGAEELDLTNVDFVASTSNKCLHGLPGVAFVLISPAGQRRAREAPRRSLYLDLANYLAAQEKRSVPFTPAIPAVYGLDAALDELLDEGIEHRKAYYRERAEFLDHAFERLGLEPRVPAPHRSRSVRSLPLPEGVGYDALHDALKEDGYIIYAGLGEAARTTFRVCALGALKVEALAGFISSLERALARSAPPVGA